MLPTTPISNHSKEIHGIDSETFHQFLTEKYGENVSPFIEWAKNTPLKGQINPKQLEEIISFYSSTSKLRDNTLLEFSSVCFILNIANDVQKDLFNLIEDQRVQEKIQQMRGKFLPEANENSVQNKL